MSALRDARRLPSTCKAESWPQPTGITRSCGPGRLGGVGARGNLESGARSASRKAGSRLSADPSTGIGVSSQGEAVTAVDEKGNSLCNFIVTFDNRTIEQASFWERGRAARQHTNSLASHRTEYSIERRRVKELIPMYSRMPADFLLLSISSSRDRGGEYAIDFTLAARARWLSMSGNYPGQPRFCRPRAWTSTSSHGLFHQGAKSADATPVKGGTRIRSDGVNSDLAGTISPAGLSEPA